MKMLLIRCPQSGELVETGNVVNEEHFQPENYQQNILLCRCKNYHRWDGKDAVLKPTEDGYLRNHV